MPAPHPATLDEQALLADCTVTHGRGSGPGGQHRNKVQTAVRIAHQPTAITGEASERRSQEANRKQALFRLRTNLALQVRHAPAPTPTPLWQSRVTKGRLAINPEHTDFPTILAEALDHLDHHQHEPTPAAQALGISSSQLVKLLKKEPRALQQVNAARTDKQKHPLR